MAIHANCQHIEACPRIKTQQVWHLIPLKYIEWLEQNQKLASCCRHPENHDISTRYSSPEDAAKGVPDIYIFHCTCGKEHIRFCVGGGDTRPYWEIR